MRYYESEFAWSYDDGVTWDNGEHYFVLPENIDPQDYATRYGWKLLWDMRGNPDYETDAAGNFLHRPEWYTWSELASAMNKARSLADKVWANNILSEVLSKLLVYVAEGEDKAHIAAIVSNWQILHPYPSED